MSDEKLNTYCNKCGKRLFRGTESERRGRIIYCPECPGKRDTPTETGESVYLIASGYEWSCHKCGQLNTCISVPRTGKVECKCCRRRYTVDDWGHCTG
jgi:hypothetical protein